MSNGYIESLENVNSFLLEMKQALCAEGFSFVADFDVLQSGPLNSTGYKNKTTMAKLHYDNKDVYNILLSLTEEDYSETVPDIKNTSNPPLHVFGREIDSREVYIKTKIRKRKRNQVFSLSFHFAEHPIKKPYSK